MTPAKPSIGYTDYSGRLQLLLSPEENPLWSTFSGAFHNTFIHE